MNEIDSLMGFRTCFSGFRFTRLYMKDVSSVGDFLFYSMPRFSEVTNDFGCLTGNIVITPEFQNGWAPIIWNLSPFMVVWIQLSGLRSSNSSVTLEKLGSCGNILKTLKCNFLLRSLPLPNFPCPNTCGIRKKEIGNYWMRYALILW